MKTRVTRTNSGVDSQGAIRFGNLELEGESYLVVLAGAVLSILCFLLCGDMGLLARALVSALPVGAALAWVKGFVHGRPPHYVGDYFEGLLTGPHFRLAASAWARRVHPLRKV